MVAAVSEEAARAFGAHGCQCSTFASIRVSLPQASIFLGMRLTFKKTFSTGFYGPGSRVAGR
jgi:hypothetical protein